MILGLSKEEYRDLVLSVGTHRKSRRLSPLEVARLLSKAVAAGATRDECATELELGMTQVRTFMKLLDLDASIQHLADWRGSKNASIPFSTMAELARLAPQEQIEAADSVLRHDLTWKEVVQVVQISNRSGKPIVECITNVLNLRPKIVTRHLFVGAITSEELTSRIKAIDQKQRDKVIATALNRIIGSDYPAKGRLGEDNFTILSDHDLPRLLGKHPDELEESINNFLETLRSSP